MPELKKEGFSEHSICSPLFTEALSKEVNKALENMWLKARYEETDTSNIKGTLIELDIFDGSVFILREGDPYSLYDIKEENIIDYLNDGAFEKIMELIKDKKSNMTAIMVADIFYPLLVNFVRVNGLLCGKVTNHSEHLIFTVKMDGWFLLEFIVSNFIDYFKIEVSGVYPPDRVYALISKRRVGNSQYLLSNDSRSYHHPFTTHGKEAFLSAPVFASKWKRNDVNLESSLKTAYINGPSGAMMLSTIVKTYYEKTFEVDILDKVQPSFHNPFDPHNKRVLKLKKGTDKAVNSKGTQTFFG